MDSFETLPREANAGRMYGICRVADFVHTVVDCVKSIAITSMLYVFLLCLECARQFGE